MIEMDESRIAATRLHALVQNLGDLVTVHDQTGTIHYATPSTARLLGYPPETLIGLNAFQLIHPDDLEIAHEALARVVASRNHGVPFEYRVRRADGVWVDVETMGANFLEDPAIQGVVLTSRIITERKRHERQMEAIASVAAALRTVATRAEMIPVILDQLMRLLAVDGAALALHSERDGDMLIALGRGRSAGLTGLHLNRDQGVCGHVIRTGSEYLSRDLLADPLFSPGERLGHDEHQPVATACLPLLAHEQTIGAIWVEKIHSGAGPDFPINDEQLHLLRAIADMAGNAIHRSTLSEQTELRLHRLIALQTIDLAISRSVDLQLTLELLLGEITSRLHIDAADVLVMDPARHELKRAASRGFTTDFITHSVAGIGLSLAGRALLERRTIHVQGLTSEKLPPELQPVLEAEGFVTYYGLPLIATGRTVGVLELFQRSPLPNDKEWIDYLDGLAAHVAVAVEKVTLIQDLQHSNTELVQSYDAVIEGWSRALATRDHETLEHARRVTGMALRLARLVGLPAEQLEHFWRGAMLHDIGKIALPDSVLLKMEPLTEAEERIFHQHPVHAFNLISPIAYLRPALDIPYCHHERWDGSGYPRGLRGNEIPLAAQIFAVVHSYDALTSDRPGRPACSQQEALEAIAREAGRGLNPAILERFIHNFTAVTADQD